MQHGRHVCDQNPHHRTAVLKCESRGFHPSLCQVDTSTPPRAPALKYNMNSAPVAHMLTSRPAASARCGSVHFQHLAGHWFAHPLQSHLPGFNSSLGCCEWAKLTPHYLYYKHTNPASYTSSCVSLLTHSPISKSSGHWASVCRTDGHGPDKTLGSRNQINTPHGRRGPLSVQLSVQLPYLPPAASGCSTARQQAP